MSEAARIALILGAGGGIGAKACAAFALAGFRVVAADLAEEAAIAAISGIRGHAVAYQVDVTDRDSIAALAESVEALGTIGAVIYAPGAVMTAPIAETDWQAYRSLMAVNLDGAFFAAAALVPKMVPGSAVVFVSSIAGRRGEAGASHYCASKFGLIGLAESLAAELGPAGIRVNAVCPGNVDTPMLAKVARDIAAAGDRAEGEAWRDLTHVGAARRLVTADEVANVCVALCEARFSAVNGSTVVVDAGASVG